MTDWPRHYHYADNEYLRDKRLLHSSIASSSEVLTILRKCWFPGLHSLEIVYTLDDQEFDLLSGLDGLSPGLVVLKLFRYPRDSSVAFDEDHALGDIVSNHSITIVLD